ncbi:MAG TPA: hypothetical protein GX014_01485 [Firmicutes bacterium]|jgi:hypothetical protein|nr:hypothetical protein [Bacillota bacterium]HHT42063.1 hypothetical protein [Bacillota bacterium]
MLPSLGFLTSMLTGLMAKAGIVQLTKHGYMPQSTYVKAALKALEEDDLDEAIRSYQLAVKKWRPSQRTEIAAEIIASAITVRIAKLQNRVDELEGVINPKRFSRQFWRNLLPKNREALEAMREEQRGFQEAIDVLAKMKDKLNEA